MTDNKNLTFNGELTKRIERWKLTLEEYDYTLTHLNGNENKNVDLLSRLCPIIHQKNHYYKYLPELSHDELKILRNEYDCDKKKNSGTNEGNKIKSGINNDVKAFVKRIHNYLVYPGVTKLKTTLRNYMHFLISAKSLKRSARSATYATPQKKTITNMVTTNKLPAFQPDECIAFDIKGLIKLDISGVRLIQNIFIC